MATTLKYDQLVQKFLDEGKAVSRSEARRYASLSEQAELRGEKTGSFKTKAGEVFDYSISPDGNSVTIQGTDRGVKYLSGKPIELPQAIQPKRRGRPPGSKNRPKGE